MKLSLMGFEGRNPSTRTCPKPTWAHLSFAVEAQDLEADAGCASRLDLVQVSEEVEPCSASAVVQLALRQDPQQGGLARVHIPQDGHPQVQELHRDNIGGRRSNYRLWLSNNFLALPDV